MICISCEYYQGADNGMAPCTKHMKTVLWDGYCEDWSNGIVEKQALIEQLKRLEKFNNSDVPEWVYDVIKGA